MARGCHKNAGPERRPRHIRTAAQSHAKTPHATIRFTHKVQRTPRWWARPQVRGAQGECGAAGACYHEPLRRHAHDAPRIYRGQRAVHCRRRRAAGAMMAPSQATAAACSPSVPQSPALHLHHLLHHLHLSTSTTSNAPPHPCAAGHRPAAQVRGGSLRAQGAAKRAARLPHPHGRGAPHQPARWRDSRRVTAAHLARAVSRRRPSRPCRLSPKRIVPISSPPGGPPGVTSESRLNRSHGVRRS